MNQREQDREPNRRTASLQIGSKAPSFCLSDDRGKRISQSDLEGRWVALYFYPRDNTSGCTREAIAFRDASGQFKRAGALIVGISRDSVDSHARFRAKHNLDFPLLSDPTTDTHKAYGAFGPKVMYGKRSEGPTRTTVLIRPDGTIARVFDRVKVDGHTEAVLKALAEEQAASRPHEGSKPMP